MMEENLSLKKMTISIRKKNLVVNLLELIQVMQRTVIIETMKLVKYKYLSVNIKTK